MPEAKKAAWSAVGSRRAWGASRGARTPRTAKASATSISSVTGAARSRNAASSPKRSTTRSGGGRSTSTASPRGASGPSDPERPHLVLPDRAVVISQVRREEMPAVVHRDEVQVTCLGRLHGGPQRGRSRVADRPGRQAEIAVGVVARVDLQVILAQVPVEGVAHRKRVDDRGIALQPHPQSETVV